MAAKSGYGNIVDSTAALAVFERGGLRLTAAAEQQLALAGFTTPERRAEAIVTATLAGMDPTQLNRPKNIVALAQATSAVVKYGALPGVHFYMTPFKVREKRGDDWVVIGEDYAFVPSINWMDASVKAQGYTDGFTYHLDVRAILGADKRREYLEVYAPDGWQESPQDRVAIARYIPFVASGKRAGEPAFGPDYQVEYQVGYYLGKGYLVRKRDGSGSYLTGSDAEMPSDKPNNTPQAKAQRRAIRAAARMVTRVLAIIDPESTQEERLHKLAQHAYERAIIAGPELLRLRQPDEAGDAVMGDDVVDGVVDSAINVAPEQGEGASRAEEEGEAGADWGDLNLAVRKAMTGEQRQIVDDLYAAKTGRTAKAETIGNIREWIAAAAPDVDITDFFFYTAFGLEQGEVATANQAKIFVPLIARQDGNKWLYAADSTGADMVRLVRGVLIESGGHESF